MFALFVFLGIFLAILILPIGKVSSVESCKLHKWKADEHGNLQCEACKSIPTMID